MVNRKDEGRMVNLRLSKRIDDLEKRIIELENNKKKPVAKKVSNDDIVKKLK